MHMDPDFLRTLVKVCVNKTEFTPPVCQPSKKNTVVHSSPASSVAQAAALTSVKTSVKMAVMILEMNLEVIGKFHECLRRGT